MKLRSTTPASDFFASLRIRAATGVLIVVAIIGGVAVLQTQVYAESNEQKIKRLESEIAEHEQKAVELNERGSSLESMIKQLQAEREKLQGSIASSQQRQVELEKEAAKSESTLKTYQETLGHTLADLYIANSISPLEMLASSGSLSDYIDQQEYRKSIQSQLQNTIAHVKTIKQKIATQQQEIKRLVADQRTQQSVLAQRQTEQQGVLTTTQGSEAAFTKLSAEKAAEKKKLQEEQQASIADAMAGAVYVPAGTISKPVEQPKPSQPAPTSPTPSNPTPSQPAPQPTPQPPVVLPNGGYPSNLANCRVDSNAMSYGIDPWGYGCRQCVSYTAWKVLQKSGRAAMYWGNANQWPNSAKARGYSVGTSPRAGSVGVMMSGPYGHVVWVESVNGNGTINISQYNYWLRGAANGGWGHYSEFKNVSPSAYQYYIYI